MTLNHEKLVFADGFVLAGGNSTRMGRDKSFVVFDGITLLERAVSVVESVFAANTLILNPVQPMPRVRIPVIRDRFTDRGAVAGFEAAFANSDATWCFFLAVDLPFVTEEVVRTICSFASNDSDVVVPRQTDGRLQPLAALYRRETFARKTSDMLGRGESPSLREMMRGERILELDAATISPDELLFLNVNKPSDVF